MPQDMRGSIKKAYMSFWGLFYFYFQEIEKLKKRLAEAEAAQQARKKPPEEKVQRIPIIPGGGLDEWVRVTKR